MEVRNVEQGSDGGRGGECNLFEFELWDAEDFLVWELFVRAACAVVF